MLTLSPNELRALTGRRRSDAQARVLDHIGVNYIRRPDGTLLVLRLVVERLAGTITEREPRLMP